MLEAAFRLASDPGGAPPSAAGVAKASGIGARSILYWYGAAETLYRLAVARRIAALTAPLAWNPPGNARPRDAVAGYAQVCAELFSSEAYRRLAYLLVRDGPPRPWLAGLHRQGVIEPMQAGLARIVRRSSPSAEIRASGTRAFVERLQRELALPMLMPSRKEASARQVAATAEAAADAAMAAIYRPGTISLALGQLVLQPIARRFPVPLSGMHRQEFEAGA